MGNYKGSLKKDFSIVKQDITNAIITFDAADVAFKSGKSQYDTTIKVFDHGVTLKANKDYKITFANTNITAVPDGGTTDSFIIEGIGALMFLLKELTVQVVL